MHFAASYDLRKAGAWVVAQGSFSLSNGLKPIDYGGHDILLFVEAVEGVSVINCANSHAWAASNSNGTITPVNADSYDDSGSCALFLDIGRC